jgi:GR25 family glycosyltransferase involved in LPS biosynthesis
MNSQVFIVSWDAVQTNVENIESQLPDCTVLNSGGFVDRSGWVNIGDVRFYNQFHEAIKRFDLCHPYMLFILGDARFYNWQYFKERCDFVFCNINVGAYAPHYDNSPWGIHQTKLEHLDVDGNLLISSQTDGIVIALHRDVVIDLLRFFDYLQEIGLVPHMRGGWGLDYVWSVLSMQQRKLIIRDQILTMNHPQGSSYSHDDAGSDMHKLLDAFIAFSENGEHVGQLIHKIQQRMGGVSLGIKDFYDYVLWYPELARLPYQVISISNDRKSKDIHDRLNPWDCLTIHTVNGYSEHGRSEFAKASNISWFAPNLKPGEIGCFGSHYMFWKFVVEHNLPAAMVFEDDAVLSKGFTERVALGLRNVPEDYDVFSVFVHPNQFSRYNDSHTVNLVVAKAYQDWSTLCYVVSQKGARKLIELSDKHGITDPVDWFIFRNGHRGIFDVYTFRPHIAPLLTIDTKVPPSIIR